MFVYFSMLFLGYVVDFNQGILSSLKQKSWWDKNYPDPKYKDDWAIALLIHSFMWSFVIMLPCLYIDNFQMTNAASLLLTANIAVHGIVDHLKANMGVLSLFIDQLIHIMQISITYILYISFIL